MIVSKRWLTNWVDREKYKETLSAGEGDEARMVVQFILDAVREIEERASAIGREAVKSKSTSGKGSKAAKKNTKNTKNTSKKGQKRKRGGKGGKTDQSPDQLEVIEEVQEEEEEGEKENERQSQQSHQFQQQQQQQTPSVNSSMILEGEGVELEVEDEESIRLSQDDENIFSQPLPGEQQEQQEQHPIPEEPQPLESKGKETPLKGDSDSFDDEPEY